MNIKSKAKIFIDFLMAAAALFLMSYQTTGEKLHEYLGIFMFALFIAHNILNFRWHKNLFRGKYGISRVIRTIINFALFIAMLCLMWSGVTMSRYAFVALPIKAGMAMARVTHLCVSYWTFTLTSVHLGFHWRAIIGFFRKLSERKNLTGIILILRILAALFAVYGAFCFWQAQTFSYMFLKAEFAFIDYEKNRALVVLQNAATAGTWIFIAYYADKAIGKISLSLNKRK